MHQALYRKWRPRTFDEVCGQSHITNVLKYELITGKTSHAYIFCGSRGTGKTSCAKILAKAINCLDPRDGNPCCECEACRAIDNGTATDIYEMDAASNNGVDDVRSIRDEVVYAPSEMKSRIYIIDEVHMLSDSAFNALLKTLEEPPTQVTFILATTEPRKIPATVLSRCQRFDFVRIPSRVIADRLNEIAATEEIPIDDSAAMYIAHLSQGGMRDAISLLELCAGESGKEQITVETVEKISGAISRETLGNVFSAVKNRDIGGIFSAIGGIYNSSKDISVFWQELLGYYRDMMIVRSMQDPGSYLDLQTDDIESMRSAVSGTSMAQLISWCRQLDDTYLAMQSGRSAEAKRVAAEVALIKMSEPELSTSADALSGRIAALENRISVLELSADSGASPEKAADTPKPAKKEAPAAAVREKPAAPAKAPEKLIPYQKWQETVDKYSASDMMTASFLNGSKAFTDEGRTCLHVILNNSFAAGMLDKDDVKTSIAALIYSDSGIKLPVGGIVFKTADKTDDSGFQYIDELMNEENNQ